jgi:hypothetical protein
LLYHALCNLTEEQKTKVLKDPVDFANTFKRVKSGEIAPINREKEKK